MSLPDPPQPKPRPRLPPRRLGVAPVVSANRAPTWLLQLSPILTLVAIVLVLAHGLIARAQLDVIGRMLLAIPGLILIGEIYRYAKKPGDRELPANVIGLLYYYVAFSFPAFFNLTFFDLSGPVTFSERAYTLAPMCIGGGVLFLYLGMRAGEGLGIRVRPAFQSMVPPIEVSPAIENATYWYAGICTLLMVSFVSAPTLIPGEIGVFVTTTMAFDFCVGLTVVLPDHFKGKWSKHASVVVLLLGSVGSLIRGVLDPALRLGIAGVAGRWANSRQVAFRLVTTFLALYLVFQPIKHDFRQQIWRARDQSSVTFTDRLNAWTSAFSEFWSRENTQSETQDAAISRLAELDAVLHAIDVLPGHVEPLQGQGWIAALSSPIPRLIWKNKPTTMSSVDQRYAVVFKRQNEIGARNTAILLPLVVEGYWNFEWIGIGISCFVMGMWCGILQKLFAGPHWALRAMGIAHLSRLVAQGPVSGLFSGLFQHVIGLLLAAWIVYGIEKLLSRPSKTSTRRFGGARPLGPIRPPARALPLGRPPSERN